jgi:hypothetical protein
METSPSSPSPLRNSPTSTSIQPSPLSRGKSASWVMSPCNDGQVSARSWPLSRQTRRVDLLLLPSRLTDVSRHGMGNEARGAHQLLWTRCKHYMLCVGRASCYRCCHVFPATRHTVVQQLPRTCHRLATASLLAKAMDANKWFHGMAWHQPSFFNYLNLYQSMQLSPKKLARTKAWTVQFSNTTLTALLWLVSE